MIPTVRSRPKRISLDQCYTLWIVWGRGWALSWGLAPKLRVKELLDLKDCQVPIIVDGGTHNLDPVNLNLAGGQRCGDGEGVVGIHGRDLGPKGEGLEGFEGEWMGTKVEL